MISPVFVGEEGEQTGRKREEKTRTKSLFLFFILFSLRGCKEMNSGIVILFLFFFLFCTL